MRAWRLPELLIAAQALALAVCVPLLMRLPTERLARLLEPRRARPSRAGADTACTTARVLRITDVVLSRGQPLVRTGCLTRGVTRYWCLRRAGIDVALCFGVAEVDGEIASHCWVVADGQPLREPADTAAFRELFRVVAPGVTRPAAMAGVVS